MTGHKSAIVDQFHRHIAVIAINRTEPVCTSVIITYNYMLICDHKPVLHTLLCLLNYTGHIGYEPADPTVHPPPQKRSMVGSFFSHWCLVPHKFFPQRKSGFCRRY